MGQPQMAEASGPVVDLLFAATGRAVPSDHAYALYGSESAYPIRRVGGVAVHGFAQISTQALRLCASHDVAVQWVSAGGFVTGALAPVAASAQRHVRQFKALLDDAACLRLAKALVAAKIESQLRFLLRATRGDERAAGVESALRRIRNALSPVHRVGSVEELLGHEGEAAAGYFSGLPFLLRPDLDERLQFGGRSRRPSRDRLNTLLNFAYGLLYRECLAALLIVGLHPGFGFYHQPRSAAHPLALDLMELFRVPLVDMAVVAALNRLTFDPESDFEERGPAVWLSSAGRRKLIEVLERRKLDEWKHSAVGYSLSYGRIIELEARLLEKEWTDDVHLFARLRLR